MTKYSRTQAANIVSLILAVGLIAGVDLDQGQVTEVVNAVLLIIAVIRSFIGRWQAGGIDAFGFRK